MLNQLFLFLSAGSIMTLALTQTLDSMTYHDCHVNNIELACKSLNK
jgi:hypothetical protein